MKKLTVAAAVLISFSQAFAEKGSLCDSLQRKNEKMTGYENSLISQIKEDMNSVSEGMDSEQGTVAYVLDMSIGNIARLGSGVTDEANLVVGSVRELANHGVESLNCIQENHVEGKWSGELNCVVQAPNRVINLAVNAATNSVEVAMNTVESIGFFFINVRSSFI